MLKVQTIFHNTIPIGFEFSEQNFNFYGTFFLSSELGFIYAAIPWYLLVKVFKIKDNTKGSKHIFSPAVKSLCCF